MGSVKKTARASFRWFRRTFFGDEDFPEDELAEDDLPEACPVKSPLVEDDSVKREKADRTKPVESGPAEADPVKRVKSASAEADPVEELEAVEELPEYPSPRLKLPAKRDKSPPVQIPAPGEVPAVPVAVIDLERILDGFSLGKRAEFETLFEKIPASGRIIPMAAKLLLFCGILFLEEPITASIAGIAASFQWIPDVSESAIRFGVKSAVLFIALLMVFGAFRRGTRTAAKSRVKSFLRFLHKNQVFSRREMETYVQREKGYEKKFL